MKGKQTFLLRLTVVVALIGFCTAMLSSSSVARAASSITGLHVSGNRILNGAGQPMPLWGANLSGTEYACVAGGGFGVFDGPHDATAVAAMVSWHINAVRVSLNEDCWLGINGAPPQFSGAIYRQGIINYVNLLNANNMMVILDLHWNAPGTTLATGQQRMPDLDHTPTFWTSVANTFKGNTSVIFDLYNEPFPGFNNATTTGWSCWRNGSTAPNTAPCADVGFAVAGMQTLIDTVRATGATNILLLGGLAFANDLRQWLQNEPIDPLNNLAAGFHLYNFNRCNTLSCWDTEIAPVAAQVPIITGELGENDCHQSFVDDAMNWMDHHNVNYMGWAWKPYGCGFPAMILGYDGTPSELGLGFKNRLTALALAGLESFGQVSSSTNNVVGEESVMFKHRAPLTNLTITITIQKDPGSDMRFLAAHKIIVGGGGRLLDISHVETATQIIYTFQQAPGTVLPATGPTDPELVAALYHANGSAVHVATHDTFVLTAQTTDGQALSDQGTIDGP